MTPELPNECPATGIGVSGAESLTPPQPSGLAHRADILSLTFGKTNASAGIPVACSLRASV
jgi:hypothetical protein